MSIGIWLSFTAACIVFSLAPGAGCVASISTSISRGFIPALVNLVGLELALGLHLLVVSAGLGALLASSATAFIILKYLGAAYLVWLGITKWSAQPLDFQESIPGQDRALRTIGRGFMINLTNPKSIVFLAAFLPQFVVPGAHAHLQYLILGTTVVVVDAAVMVSYACLASLARPHLSNPRVMKLQNRIFGGLFVLVGLGLAKAKP